MVESERGSRRSIAGRTRSIRRLSAGAESSPPSSAAGSPARRDPPAPAPPVPSAPSRRGHFAPPAVDPALPAGAASRGLLAHLGGAVRQHAEEILGGDQAEAIHDLRVALRRARGLLGPLRSVFSRAETERLRAGVRWLGELTGPSRDLEVLLERLTATRGELPDEDRGDVDRLAAEVSRDRDDAKRALDQGLRSPRYGRLLQAWAALSSPVAARPPRSPHPEAVSPPPLGARPIGEVAAAAIDRAWRRLVRHGRALDDDSASEAFHRVRIDGKKLRYLIELFRSAYPGVDLEPILANLKELQDGLGELNDAQVQGEVLRRMASRLAAERPPDRAESADATGALLLTGRLIERSARTATAGRRRCRERFEALDTKENRRRIRSLAVD